MHPHRTSDNPQVESLRRTFVEMLPDEEPPSTTFLERTWSDLERYAGPGQAQAIMWGCLGYAIADAEPQKDRRTTANQGAKALHDGLMTQVQEAIAAAKNLEDEEDDGWIDQFDTYVYMGPGEDDE